MHDSSAPIREVRVASYTIPTESPESDGTLEWHATTMVVVHVSAGGCEGMGYGYADRATARVVEDHLAPYLAGKDALATNARWADMVQRVRNVGARGIACMAISAVDAALWDLKGRLLDAPVATLLGVARGAVEIYGSGGFTSYSVDELRAQLGGWAKQGFRAVKMKVGRDPGRDFERVRAARDEIGDATALFVDANGAYSGPQALGFANAFGECSVRWFEEPVSSDDLDGLARIRSRRPADMAIAAGEYGYRPPYFRRMLDARAVDVLQADATRCGGVTGFMAVAELCDAYEMPLSSHCAPALHVALCCAARRAIHLEYFHDHVRIEQQLFDGVPRPSGGTLAPDLSRPGLGLELKTQEAECFRS